MITKKAQQDIIVTVLLVLVALAAVALIATFVVRNVQTNTKSADNQAQCLTVMLSIPNALAGATVGVKREVGGDQVSVGKLKVLVNGEVKNETEDVPAILTTKQISAGTIKKGDKIEAAATLADGYTCPAGATFTVV